MGTIVGIFQNAWSTIIGYLPGSPFTAFINNIEEIPYLQEVNWIIPISEMIVVLEVWLTAVAIYYTYSAIMRFIRLIK